MPMGQQQIDVWGLVLKIAKWAARIPLAALVIFSAGCLAFLGFYTVLRSTQWVWFKWLQHPWY